MRPTRLAVGIVTLLIATSAPSLAATPASPARSADSAPVTLFVAHRRGLLIKLWLDPHAIVGSDTWSRVRCEGGGSASGSGSISEGTRIAIKRGGHFKRSELEAYEGSGFYFTGLAGVVHANRIVGEYRAWEERLGEEDVGWLPRCGTGSPRGLPLHFIAHRVTGPPWRPRR